MRRFAVAIFLVVTIPPSGYAIDASPRSLDPRLAIGLFAESPEIVTPTGVDVDAQGRVWAIENNTHFRPPNYAGHASDRLRVFYDDDHDGKSDRVETFADGFVYAMSVAVRPDGVYLATRRDLVLLSDSDHDGKADGRRVILRLETKGDYPHNGLAGLAFDGLDNLYIGLGENEGKPYRLVGSDGRSHSGGGEGGSVFRCRPDGSNLTLWATGFWNPHASCVDAFGHLFSVDNDPDYRPPCRLVHVIPGGDYGFRYRNGRRGIHPFTAWDGELPGTLPMTAGTGEAPSGVLAYEADAFPNEYRGSLIATSWGDHRVDRFRVHPRGTSFTSKFEPIIVGDENFRPVGVALAPDGCLYVTDWVLKDYHVHGKGRIWRIAPSAALQRPADDLATLTKLPDADLRGKMESPRLTVRRAVAHALANRDPQFLKSVVHDAKAPRRSRVEAVWALARPDAKSPPLRSSLKNPEMRTLWPDFDAFGQTIWGAALLERLKHPSSEDPPRALLRLVDGFAESIRRDAKFLGRVVEIDDPFVFATVVQCLTDRSPAESFAQALRPEATPAPRVRLALLLAARQSRRTASPVLVLQVALRDPDFVVRRTAIQWAGEEKVVALRSQIEAQLADSTTTSDLFDAALATLELLDGVKHSFKDEPSGADYALKLALDEHASADVRARALRMVPAAHKGLNAALLQRFLASPFLAVRTEALRTLRETTFPETPGLLRAIAGDARAPFALRIEAIGGLASVLQRNDHDAATIDTLRRLLAGSDGELRIAALRALRHTLRTPSVQSDCQNLIGDVRKSGGGAAESQRLVDQLALAFRASGLPLPKTLAGRESPRPQSADAWVALGEPGGDAERGRRVFEHPNAGGCIRCHTVNGRGGRIGPDLSTIARSSNRRKLAESIVQPSKEIAPQFTGWALVTHSGRTLTGLILSEDREGRIRIGTPEGEVTEISTDEIEERRPQATSVMPDRLVDLLTVDEFRDLVAFLLTLK